MALRPVPQAPVLSAVEGSSTGAFRLPLTPRRPSFRIPSRLRGTGEESLCRSSRSLLLTLRPSNSSWSRAAHAD